jgi:hypothetical protein
MTRGGFCVAVLLGLAGPSDMIGWASEDPRRPVELASVSADAAKTLELASPAAILLDSGHERRLARGTTLSELGRIGEGRVFKPTNASVSPQGARRVEAWPVLRKNLVVGFYLPDERAFAPLSRPAPLQIEEAEALVDLRMPARL